MPRRPGWWCYGHVRAAPELGGIGQESGFGGERAEKTVSGQTTVAEEAAPAHGLPERDASQIQARERGAWLGDGSWRGLLVRVAAEGEAEVAEREDGDGVPVEVRGVVAGAAGRGASLRVVTLLRGPDVGSQPGWNRRLPKQRARLEHVDRWYRAGCRSGDTRPCDHHGFDPRFRRRAVR